MARSYDYCVELLLPPKVLARAKRLAQGKNPFIARMLCSFDRRPKLDQIMVIAASENVFNPLAYHFTMPERRVLAVASYRSLRKPGRDRFLREAHDAWREVAVQVFVRSCICESVLR